MTRLAEHYVTNLVWSEDEDGVYADGHQSYEIDENNEIAVFQGAKCIQVINAADFDHAVSMILAHENVCRLSAIQGRDHRGKPVNERGWRV